MVDEIDSLESRPEITSNISSIGQYFNNQNISGPRDSTQTAGSAISTLDGIDFSDEVTDPRDEGKGGANIQALLAYLGLSAPASSGEAQDQGSIQGIDRSTELTQIFQKNIWCLLPASATRDS